METILKITRDGDNVNFTTDLDPVSNPELIHDVIIQTAMAMMTTLWGGNEHAVLAMIRAIAVADLGVSVNRQEMVAFLDDASRVLADSLADARAAFVQNGGKITTFAPGVPKPDQNS